MNACLYSDSRVFLLRVLQAAVLEPKRKMWLTHTQLVTAHEMGQPMYIMDAHGKVFAHKDYEVCASARTEYMLRFTETVLTLIWHNMRFVAANTSDCVCMSVSFFVENEVLFNRTFLGSLYA